MKIMEFLPIELYNLIPFPPKQIDLPTLLSALNEWKRREEKEMNKKSKWQTIEVRIDLYREIRLCCVCRECKLTKKKVRVEKA